MFMQSSRDSSIWRSLAVAFGDGVAFGVGVKLAQGPNRPPAVAPPAEPAPAPDRPERMERLDRLEQRLAAIEQAPPPPSAPSPAPFDQKVLEAVVNALDARLHEQAGHVESRLTELEAKRAIELKGLQQQDHAIATGLQSRIEEVHGQYNEHITAMRDAVAEDMDILYGQVAQLREDYTGLSDGLAAGLEQRIAAAVAAQVDARLAALLAPQLDARMESAETRLRNQVLQAVDRMSAATASSMAAGVEEKIAPLRSALAEKDREIAELRQRLVESDQNVLDLILTIGQMCRQVAERISVPAPAPVVSNAVSEAGAGPPPDQPEPPAPSADASAAPPEEPPVEEPPAAEAPPDPPAIAAVPLNGSTNGHAVEPMPMVPADSSIPAFAHSQRPSRLWRIPLVSSFFLMLAAGSLYALK